MARMVNVVMSISEPGLFGLRCVDVSMCRLRNELRILWRPPLTTQLLPDVRKEDSFPVVSDD
jgi:hypothetical protein